MSSPVRETDELSTYGIENDTVCTICSAEFLDSEDLLIHKKQVHTFNQHSLAPCAFCDSNFPDVETYCVHIRDEHLTHLRQCKFCSKVFSNSIKHNQHEKKHKVGFSSFYLCSQCPENFTNFLDLENHEVEKHNNNEDGVVLHNIHDVMSSVLNIKFTIFMNNIPEYICVICGFVSKNMMTYITHLQENNCKTYVCDKCCNVYKNRKNLVFHMLRKCPHTAEVKDRRRKKCTQCKQMIEKSDFRKHKRNCRIIKCVACNIAFDTMLALTEHQTKEHQSAIDIKLCVFCHRECVGTVSLIKHIERSHKHDFHLYKYLCKECNTIFKHPQKLFAHYVIKHKYLEPYTCRICDLNFRIRKKFTLHIKLNHKSIGFVEFDENYHVYFVEKKSENPFIPTSLIGDSNFDLDIPGLKSLIKSGKKTLQQKSKTTKLQNKQIDDDDETNCESDDDVTVCPTETEGNQTEIEEIKRKKQKHKTKRVKLSKRKTKVQSDDSSDDEPLQNLKRKLPRTRKDTQSSFTCNVCNKYCYTYQNYHNHMSLHSRTEVKTCIKCSRTFKTKDALTEHIENEHSTSKLTEYLRNILESRKSSISKTVDDQPLTVREKLIRTIKKVKSDHMSTKARIQSVTDSISAKNFIENFVPFDKNITVHSNVIVKAIETPFYRKPVIKMTKFQPKADIFNGKLAMPMKCKSDQEPKVKVTMKLVTVMVQDDCYNQDVEDSFPTADHFDDNSRDEVPDVAVEVMLDNTTIIPDAPQPPKEIKPIIIPHKIVIENIPKDYNDISIAHLLPEAPFYKIVKINDVLKTELQKQEEEEEKVNLPNGAKLVVVNPLAHLMGDKPVEQILKPKKNYYKAKRKKKNVENIITKALVNFNSCPKSRAQNRKSQKSD